MSEERGANHKYHKSLLPATRNAANTGMTERELAEFLGISYQTLLNWKSDIPEFREAIVAGKEGPNQRVVAALYQSAIGYTVEIKKGQVNKQGELVEWTETQFIKPEVTAQIFFLKNRDNQNWNDRNGNAEGSFENLSDAELARLVRDKASRLVASKAADKVLEGVVITERPVKNVTPKKA